MTTPPPNAQPQQDCPKCGHAWSRHSLILGHCTVRTVDASGNFDGCDCDAKPPVASQPGEILGVCFTDSEPHEGRHTQRPDCVGWKVLEQGEICTICGGSGLSASLDQCAACKGRRFALQPREIGDGARQFRKKPVVIEAIQWTGTNREALEAFCPAIRYADALKSRPIIDTLKGFHSANIRDWIIRGVIGEFYPCNPDVFAATYEAAAAIPASPAQSLREKIDHNCKTTGDWKGRTAQEIAMAREDVPDTEYVEVAPPAPEWKYRSIVPGEPVPVTMPIAPPAQQENPRTPKSLQVNELPSKCSMESRAVIEAPPAVGQQDEDRAHLQTIDERDRAENALSEAFFLVTGRSPEWSNLFGYDEALQEIDDAQQLLRKSIMQAPTPSEGAELVIHESETCLQGLCEEIPCKMAGCQCQCHKSELPPLLKDVVDSRYPGWVAYRSETVEAFKAAALAAIAQALAERDAALERIKELEWGLGSAMERIKGREYTMDLTLIMRGKLTQDMKSKIHSAESSLSAAQREIERLKRH